MVIAVLSLILCVLCVLGNGPAGNHNKILVSGQPDFLGPFFDLYRDWCGRGVKKAIDYGDKKVPYMHTH